VNLLSLLQWTAFAVGLLCVMSASMSDDILRWYIKRRIGRLSEGGQLQKLILRYAGSGRISSFDLEQIIYGLFGLSVGALLAIIDPIQDWDVSLRLLVVALVGALGFRIPAMKKERHERLQRKAIEEDLPSIIDLLVVMLDSGASFDVALDRVLAERHFSSRPINSELSVLARELALSPDRESIFRKFGYGSEIDGLRLLMSTLAQSELYGTPVAVGLRNLAFEMRQRQYHKLESKSGALGPKLAIPMTLFFLPLIFIIVLAPTLIRTLKLP